MLEDYFFTENTRYILWGAFALLIALLIFHAGVVIGEHQPMHQRFGPGDNAPGPLGGFMPKEAFINDHGAVGTIATVTLPTFILMTRGGMNQVVEISSSTAITGGATGTAKDLAPDETVIVIGDPQETDTDTRGDLDARVIKIAPPLIIH